MSVGTFDLCRGLPVVGGTGATSLLLFNMNNFYYVSSLCFVKGVQGVVS